jgi:hypothetical protein
MRKTAGSTSEKHVRNRNPKRIRHANIEKNKTSYTGNFDDKDM